VRAVDACERLAERVGRLGRRGPVPPQRTHALEKPLVRLASRDRHEVHVRSCMRYAFVACQLHPLRSAQGSCTERSV